MICARTFTSWWQLRDACTASRGTSKECSSLSDLCTPRQLRDVRRLVMDITQLILDDHHEQRRLFAILEQVASRDRVTAGEVWSRLAAFLELHAAAEEQYFYPALIRAGLRSRHTKDVEGETHDAIKDHNEIRDTIAE